MKRILLVEDEPAISEMIRFALEREGYAVDEAADVKDARRMMANKRPDLAEVDWMLPDISGVDMVRGLRRDELNRDMPVIMLTARAEENDKVIGLESGADDYMTKPVAIQPRTKVRSLVKLGVRVQSAVACGITAKGPWRSSKTAGVIQCLSKISGVVCVT